MHRVRSDFRGLAGLVSTTLGPGLVLVAAYGNFRLFTLLLSHILISDLIGMLLYNRRSKAP
jgi:hypothetical protein